MKFRSGEAADFIETPGIDNFQEFLAAGIKDGREHCPTIVSVISQLESENNLANVFASRLVPGSVIRHDYLKNLIPELH